MKISILIILNFILSWMLLKWCYYFLLKNNIFDHPNQRSLHSIPKVRGGGIAILLCYEIFIFIFYLLGYLYWNFLIAQLAGGIILGMVGWIDDRNHVPVIVRFTCHFISAIILLFLFNWVSSIKILGAEYYIYFFGNIVFVFYAVWMINLFNFMDGIDGIAVSELIVPSVFIAIVFGINNHYELSLISVIIIASSIFFYKYNWPPSKMFMGDVFSGFIGFYFASITLYINNVLKMSVLIVPVLLSVFIYDATITLVRRILKKEKIWQPHSTHYYQKFAKKYGHKKVTVSVIVINIILFVPAYLIFIKPEFDLYIAFFTYLILFLSEFLLELKFLKDTPVKNRYI